MALVLTLVQPLYGLLLVVLAVPFGSLLRLPVAGMNVGATEAVVWLVLAAWGMRLVARREVRLRFTWLSLALALLLGVMLISLLGATSLEHGAKELVKWIEVLGLYLLVSQELDERWLRALVVAILLTGGLAALQGIYQFVFRIGPDGFVLFGRFMRAYGMFEQPNPYAGYLGLSIPIGLGVLAGGLRPGVYHSRWRWSVLAGGTSILMLAAMVMSWSRGAWLGLAAAAGAMAVVALLRTQKRLLFVTLAALVVAGGLLVGGLVRVPSSVVQRVADLVPFLTVKDVRGMEVTDANYAVLERMAHWQAAVSMWADHPWFGVGIGNYEVAYPRYALPTWNEPLGHAHNYYLNIGAEAGLAGLLAYLLVWSIAWTGAWRACRYASGWLWGVALGILGIIVHLCVHSLFDNLFVHGMYLQVAILLGTIPHLRQRTS
jgi:O-antigen ligase